MAKIQIGTCSWTDPTLLATGFYPKEAGKPEKRLQYYASHFSLVEVDSIYYAQASVVIQACDFYYGLTYIPMFVQW